MAVLELLKGWKRSFVIQRDFWIEPKGGLLSTFVDSIYRIRKENLLFGKTWVLSRNELSKKREPRVDSFLSFSDSRSQEDPRQHQSFCFLLDNLRTCSRKKRFPSEVLQLWTREHYMSKLCVCTNSTRVSGLTDLVAVELFTPHKIPILDRWRIIERIVERSIGTRLWSV